MATGSQPIPSYERRLILFLDILGFREIVNGTTTNPKALRTVLSAIDSISELREPDLFTSKQVSQFSDSIVVSFSISEKAAVFSLVNGVALTIITIVDHGFLVRGAVTVGDLIHTDKYLIGPAMVRAYEMESKEAANPRVIFDPQILTVARRYHAAQNSPDDEEGYIRSLLTHDVDGKLYFDFVSWGSVVEEAGVEANLYGEYLFKIGKMAAECLRHENISVIRKGCWLLQHYLAAVDEIAAERPESAFYSENLELCSSIGGFPRYKELSKIAEANI